MSSHKDTPPSSNSPSRKKKSSPLPPPPKFHSTTERLPVLESAPPSASTSFMVNQDNATIVADLPPPPKMSGISAAPALVQMTPSLPVLQEPIVPPRQPEELTEPERLPFVSDQHDILARRQSHIPVLVIATEAAHRMAWKNSLRLVDLLRGLSHDLEVEGIPLPPFRSVHRSMLLHWENLHLDFLEPSDYTPADTADYLDEYARVDHESNEFLEEQVESILQDEPIRDEETRRDTQLQQQSQQAFSLTSAPDSPWLNRYRTALDYSTNALPHDVLQTPALVLLVCSSNEVAPPIDCLRELSSPHFLPKPFHNGQYDPSSLRAEAIVLHDVVDGGTLENEVMLQKSLVRTFGGGACILKVNSILPETAARTPQEQQRAMWGSGKGQCMSPKDCAVVRRYLATMMTSTLLPALERRISDLNFIVMDRKKGVKNVFKSLWRKPKEEGTAVETQVESRSASNYRCDSIESQVRLLADTLFLVRDWDAALGMYRLIKDDYKADKAMMEYGSANEMMALATYLMDPVGKNQETFSYMETALYSYTRAAEEERPAGASRPTQASHATRLATRLCLVMAAANEVVQDRPLEVADLLASASSHETPLGAAALLEQSSAHYYHAGMYRKYAFHMLMSGHMFRTALQEHHAFRCFTSALYIYHDGRWDELHNHIKSALAAQLYSLGEMSVSVQLYAKLVGTRSGGRVSTKSQQKFLQHLQEICQDHTEKAMDGADRMAMDRNYSERIHHILQVTEGAKRILELPNMDLPSVDDSSVSVHVESEQLHCEIPSFGILGEGNPAVWDELKCHAEAELKAIDPYVNIGDGSPTLAKIEDPLIRKVVAAIDKEKKTTNLLAKAKRSGNYKESPAVRARMEPLSIQFVVKNPLTISIEVKDMQLVAQITESRSQRVCTNENAIQIGAHSDKRKPWTFSGSNAIYESPEFCHVSGTTSGEWKSSAEENPFFVVTKFDLTLEANSSVRVSLGICPLVVGSMEILGVRCKLFNDVWVYHSFDVKGPLLQNTSENRANRVRAESMLLKAKIEQDMPRLTASLIQKREGVGDGPLLVGQLSSWTLRLSNTGTAPASHVSLKTNVPWINVVAPLCPLTAAEPTPHCIGPSGTLTDLPLEDPTLKTPSVLHPGESVDIPIIIRSPDGGSHSLYMLYRYELWDPSSDSTKHRWLQNMFSVPASPSLTLTASLMPSFWKQHEYVLSVEMTNYRSDKSTELDVTLDKLCILSRHYRMELLEGQLGETQPPSTPFRLEWQERVTLHYRVIPLNEAAAACMLSECQFSEGQVEVMQCLTGPTTNYLCMERAQQEFQDVLRSHQIELARAAAAEESGGHPRSIAQIRRAKSSLSGVESITDPEDEQNDQITEVGEGIAHPTSIAKLCPVDSSKAKLNMVCTWSAVGGGNRTDIVHGQHHFTRLSVRPTTSTRGCPITITCRHPSKISHDFEKGALNIPFEITLRNRLVDAGVFFEFSVQRPRGFDFIGTESFEWALEGGEELTVPIQAVVPKGGVYNLQCVRLTVTKTDKKVPYLFPLQWIVRVNA